MEINFYLGVLCLRTRPKLNGRMGIDGRQTLQIRGPEAVIQKIQDTCAMLTDDRFEAVGEHGMAAHDVALPVSRSGDQPQQGPAAEGRRRTKARIAWV